MGRLQIIGLILELTFQGLADLSNLLLGPMALGDLTLQLLMGRLQIIGPILELTFQGLANLSKLLLGPLALCDILKGEENQRGSLAIPRDAMGIEQHRPTPDRRKLMVHLKVLDLGVLREHLLQQRPQPGNVPLAVAHLVD